MDRGRAGRVVAGDLGTSSRYEEDRLRAGLVVIEEAGDCCDGGVYGISSRPEMGGEALVVGEGRLSRGRH